MPDPAVAGDAPRGAGLHVSTGGDAAIATREGVVPADWSACETISLWIHRSHEEAQRRAASTIELQLVEAPGVRAWRKVVVDHAGWRRFELPLRFFGWDATRTPRLDRVVALVVRFRDAAELVLDGIRVHDRAGGPGAHLALDDVRRLAFGEPREADGVRALVRPDLEIVTDAAALDLAALAARLERAAALLEPLAPAGGDPRRTPRLIVFAGDEAYRAFAPRVAEAFGRVAASPRSDGFTLLALAHAAGSEAHGSDRPVFVHEFVHSWLECRALLPNQGEWIQEGLANHVQMELHPQPGLATLMRDALADPAAAVPLVELTGGGPIGGARYWQAMALVQALLELPRYADRFGKLVAALRDAGSTALSPHLGPVLATDLEQLERDWRDHAAARYAEPPPDGG